MSVMLEKKNQQMQQVQPDESDNIWQELNSLPPILEPSKKQTELKRKLRKRTTILPIFLKKMQDKKGKYPKFPMDPGYPLYNKGNEGNKEHDEGINLQELNREGIFVLLYCEPL